MGRHVQNTTEFLEERELGVTSSQGQTGVLGKHAPEAERALVGQHHDVSRRVVALVQQHVVQRRSVGALQPRLRPVLCELIGGQPSKLSATLIGAPVKGRVKTGRFAKPRLRPRQCHVKGPAAEQGPSAGSSGAR